MFLFSALSSSPTRQHHVLCTMMTIDIEKVSQWRDTMKVCLLKEKKNRQKYKMFKKEGGTKELGVVVMKHI